MIKKKVYGLVAILSLSFAGVAMAASSDRIVVNLFLL